MRFCSVHDEDETAKLIRVSFLNQAGKRGRRRLLQAAQLEPAGALAEIHLAIQIQSRRIVGQKLLNSSAITAVEYVQPGRELKERHPLAGSGGLAFGHLWRGEIGRWLRDLNS